MKPLKRIAWMIVVLFPLTALAQQVHLIEMKAEDQHFIPETITVKAGEVVKLKITAKKDEEISKEGYVHSFAIKKLGLEFKLKEGPNQFTFVAPDKPGTYKFECTVDCGTKHDYMTGRLEVE